MRRRALPLVVVVLGLGAAIAVADVPSNPRAGRAVAYRILATARLPPGSRRSPGDPSGSKLAKPGTYPATRNLVDLHSFWRVPGDLRTVFDWIQSHPPAMSSGEEGGAMGKGGGIVSEYFGYWLLSPRRGGAPMEMLLFTGAPARGGGTALRVDAQVVWLLERAASERIPAGTDSIAVSEVRADGTESHWSVANPARIRRSVAILNSLPVVQPGTVACPADRGPIVTLKFTRGGSRVATASVDGGGCEIVQLWIHGHREHPLQGNDRLIKRLSRALGISL